MKAYVRIAHVDDFAHDGPTIVLERVEEGFDVLRIGLTPGGRLQPFMFDQLLRLLQVVAGGRRRARQMLIEYFAGILQGAAELEPFFCVDVTFGGDVPFGVVRTFLQRQLRLTRTARTARILVDGATVRTENTLMLYLI